MSKKIEIEWLSSPFGHAKYTLVTSYKKMRKMGYDPDCDLPHPAVTYFFDDNEIIVYVNKKCGASDSEVMALIVHEAVHVWQKIAELMGESEPSKEFEAYSIQTIFLGLLSLYR